MRELSEQEQFWLGRFGAEYLQRNQGEQLYAANLALFADVLRKCDRIESLLELGTNRGMNLMALRALLPQAELEGVEINPEAAKLAGELNIARIHEGSLLDFSPSRKFDMVLVKGVLIHIAPDLLAMAYKTITAAASRYILLVEYYNPNPVEVIYRGNAGKLFKRDFAGELMDLYPDVGLVDYGFIYHRDRNFPQDDVNWFLLEKK